ncbi:MAG: hypothetical protein ABIG44_15125 [Planctomycetota bacterium]
MPATLAVPESMLESVSAFVTAEALGITVVAGDQGDVQVLPGEERDESKATILQPGGWIACIRAFQMSDQLGLSRGNAGKLLNHLDIKIRACQLGCFA